MTLKTQFFYISNCLEHHNCANGTKLNHIMYLIIKILFIMLNDFHFMNDSSFLLYIRSNAQTGKYLRNDILLIPYYMKTVYPY